MVVTPGGGAHRDGLGGYVRGDPPAPAALALLVAEPDLAVEVDHGCSRGVPHVCISLLWVQIGTSGNHGSGIESGEWFDIIRE